MAWQWPAISRRPPAWAKARLMLRALRSIGVDVLAARSGNAGDPLPPPGVRTARRASTPRCWPAHCCACRVRWCRAGVSSAIGRGNWPACRRTGAGCSSCTKYGCRRVSPPRQSRRSRRAACAWCPADWCCADAARGAGSLCFRPAGHRRHRADVLQPRLSFERKNPLATIAAFRAAGNRKDRQLLLKVGNPDHFPRDFAALRAAAQRLPISASIPACCPPRTTPHDPQMPTSSCRCTSRRRHGLVPAEAMHDSARR